MKIFAYDDIVLINSRRSSQTNKIYSSEQELVDHFMSSMDHHLSPWGIAGVNSEFNYVRGTTDIVIINKNGAAIAIEAKLDKWEYAIQKYIEIDVLRINHMCSNQAILLI